jgi:hypothetical protein
MKKIFYSTDIFFSKPNKQYLPITFGLPLHRCCFFGIFQGEWIIVWKGAHFDKSAWMDEVENELIRNGNEVKRPSRVNTRDIRPRVDW